VRFTLPGLRRPVGVTRAGALPASSGSDGASSSGGSVGPASIMSDGLAQRATEPDRAVHTLRVSDEPQPSTDQSTAGGRAGGDDADGTFLHRLRDAAIEAEYETGHREETEAEARRGVWIRIARIVGGFTVIGLGIAALPLPGPGWLIIIFGLDLLPFTWAERTILLIRRNIPGVPEEGRIPLRTWLIMGTIVLVFSVISLVYGDDIMQWLRELWGDPDSLFG
jgi:hypothetical protein